MRLAAGDLRVPFVETTVFIGEFSGAEALRLSAAGMREAHFSRARAWKLVSQS